MRAARETDAPEDEGALRAAAGRLGRNLSALEKAGSLDTVRGFEGESARCNVGAFSHMIRENSGAWTFSGRNRRPPRDPVNALLSFLYALVRHDCESALEGVGLDPQVGYLHGLRPGRPALALDLMEDEARKAVVVAHQRRKQDEVEHPVLERKVALGLVPHIQARLLARHLRGDLEAYLPYLSR
ncbi:MAG: CRISPR-associated endonuclease Cas1 [Nitrospinota bacterium]|jgi:CRISPR-associated protein Cas1|nr:CRISPR-associated endonuclease Cas1 [Nitrospinota bacterium]